MSMSRLVRLFGDNRCVPNGRAVHAKIITSGSTSDVYTNNHLLAMYVKFSRITDARNLFDRMPKRNLISWSALISGYSQMGMAEEALCCFKLMVSDGFEPNDHVYVGVLSACASMIDARTGKEIHGRICRSYVEFSTRVGNCLINMYGKCGLLGPARFVFDAIPEPDSVSWTALLSCCCQCGENLEGLEIFSWSRGEGILLNEFSCATVLGASAALEDLKLGKQIHPLVVKCGFEPDKFVVTGLINLYAKCGDLDSAFQAFSEADHSNLSVWTALIGGYAQQGKGREAINIFCLLHSSGLTPNERTFSAVLAAFSDANVAEIGIQLHSHIIKMGYSPFLFVANAVVDLYSKCGLCDEALRTFKEMENHDIVSWNALISGRVGSGHFTDAAQFLKDMMFKGYCPNLYTFSSLLTICANIPAIEWGKQAHCSIIKPGFDSSIVVGTALIDMYSKCGRLTYARKIFDNLNGKNLVSWNTMLVGYAQHGFGREALMIYSMMLRNEIKPNDITFLGVLSACGHVGLVEEGWNHFNSMITDYGIAPTMEHLASLINLFARKGQTRRAYELIKSFSLEPSKVVWRCLLSGCKTHKDVVLGKYAAERILSIDPGDTSAHIMLSNIYADAKMWDETVQMRKIMKEKALKKDTGYSWTELKNRIYSFSATNCMEYEGINLVEVLNGLNVQLFDAGYVPDALFSWQIEE